MRTRSPARRTLPSSTVVTFSFSPIVRRSTLLPLKEKADVRAATRRPASPVRAFRISSAIPSQNQSLVLGGAHIGEGQHGDGRHTFRGRPRRLRALAHEAAQI